MARLKVDVLARLSPEATPAVAERVHGDEPASALLRHVLTARPFGAVAAVSSFGADSAVLLHMVSEIDAATPVLFVDTGKHFPETLAYRDRLVAMLGLSDVRSASATAVALAEGDPTDMRHASDPDGCCELRKVQPLERALAAFDLWITGRRRDQSVTREAMPRFEHDRAGRLKFNPLADWSAAEIAAYRARHALPDHPLVALGYPSIGCAACTTRVEPDEDPRAGRWRGREKTECGLHLVDGRLVGASGSPAGGGLRGR